MGTKFRRTPLMSQGGDTLRCSIVSACWGAAAVQRSPIFLRSHVTLARQSAAWGAPPETIPNGAPPRCSRAPRHRPELFPHDFVLVGVADHPAIAGMPQDAGDSCDPADLADGARELFEREPDAAWRDHVEAAAIRACDGGGGE